MLEMLGRVWKVGGCLNVLEIPTETVTDTETDETDDEIDETVQLMVIEAIIVSCCSCSVTLPLPWTSSAFRHSGCFFAFLFA